MAKTGIKILTADSVLGAPIDVNTTSMLIFITDDETLDPVKVRSIKEAEEIFKNSSNVSVVTSGVKRYYYPSTGVGLEGSLLWVGVVSDIDAGTISSQVLKTVEDSFGERPRQVIVVDNFNTGARLTTDVAKTVVATLADNSIRCVIISSTWLDSFSSPATVVTDSVPFLAKCVVGGSNEFEEDGYTFGGIAAGALLSTVSVGTSIGDGGLSALDYPTHILEMNEGNIAYSVRSLTLEKVEELGEKGYLFTRTRPPRNGLWWNDGATCNDPANALSTLEAARTICAMADDLQSFFVPYINTRVPVTNTGDIQSAYKQVVLDNARAAVVQKYIESGDISDARINLVAKNNDMIGTRTWEVTLSILPAPTLRWIDGYVFYVNSLE